MGGNSVHNYKYKVLLLLCASLALSQLTQAEQTVENANAFLSQIIADGHAQMDLIVTRLPTQRTYKYSKRGWFSTPVENQGTDEVMISVMWKKLSERSMGKENCLWGFLGSLKPVQFSWENDWRNSATEYIYEHNYTKPEMLKLNFDWGKVKVARTTHFWDNVELAQWSDTDENNKKIPGTSKLKMSIGANIRISPNQAKYGEVIQFRADDAMLDRIEYAVKFLQLSCDRTASTGF